MANYCKIKNNKNVKIDEIQSLIVNDLKAKFGLDVKTSIELLSNGEVYLEFKIKNYILPYWFKSNEVEGYDVPSTAFDRHNQKIGEDYDKFCEGSLLYHSYFIYALFYDYLKHLMAKFLETNIESDGAGDFEPFSHSPEKYDSGDNWIDYWKNSIENRKSFFNFGVQSLEQYRFSLKQEFPELFTK